MGAAQTREYVDRRYEDHDVSELPDAPVEALRGLGKRGGEALRRAFGVKTIRDLATSDVVLKAQELVRLAEGPAAIPAVGAAPVAATGPAHHQRERAGEQALTRSEEELQVGTRRVPRDQEQISEPVRKEQIEVDQPDGER